MKYLLICAFLFTSIKAFTYHTPGYTITGTATGLPDGTWLYLRSSNPAIDFDSCRVTNNKFYMSGRIIEKAAPVLLHTAKYKNYVHLWLENAPINIIVNAGEFKKGIITGSATQDEDKQLDLLLKPYNKLNDSLERVFESAKEKQLKEETKVQLNTVASQIGQINRNWIRSHYKSLVAADLLNIYSAVWGKDTTVSLYNNLSPETKGSPFGKDIKEFIAFNKNIKLGDKFTDFEEVNTTGKKVRLSDIKGKYILLDFWASWCGPCLEENPRLVSTYIKFKDRGFKILGVSLDENKTDWSNAIKNQKLTWENVSDLRGDKNKAALIYGVTGIPCNFLIDGNGIIIAKDLRGKDLDDKLAELLP